MLLDAIFGEPRALWDRVPHPAVLMGRVIGAMDKRFNTQGYRRAKGVAVMLALALGALTLGIVVHTVFGWVGDVVICAMLLAQKSLADHVRAVADALRLSLGDGRKRVGMIVGRDTAEMDQSAVARGAIESAFWFAIGGLPALLLYKITNTADSMIGYKTPRHSQFGWAAARLDDVLNWIPARLTGLLIWALNPRVPIGTIRCEAGHHRSPNAGWPEAAMAHNLGIALSGPRMYNGTQTNDPFVNPLGAHTLDADDIDNAVAVLWKTWAAAFCIALLIAFV